MNMKYALRSEDTEQINVIQWVQYQIPHHPELKSDSVEVASSLSERRQQEQSGSGETETDGSEGGDAGSVPSCAEGDI